MPRTLLLHHLFGSRHPRHGYGRRRHRRHRSGGFGMTGPFPSYSRRTRGGGRVSVGGCCLPIPLGLFVVAGALGRMFTAGRR